MSRFLTIFLSGHALRLLVPAVCFAAVLLSHAAVQPLLPLLAATPPLPPARPLFLCFRSFHPQSLATRNVRDKVRRPLLAAA